MSQNMQGTILIDTGMRKILWVLEILQLSGYAEGFH